MARLWAVVMAVVLWRKAGVCFAYLLSIISIAVFELVAFLSGEVLHPYRLQLLDGTVNHFALE